MACRVSLIHAHAKRSRPRSQARAHGEGTPARACGTQQAAAVAAALATATTVAVSSALSRHERPAAAAPAPRRRARRRSRRRLVACRETPPREVQRQLRRHGPRCLSTKRSHQNTEVTAASLEPKTSTFLYTCQPDTTARQEADTSYSNPDYISSSPTQSKKEKEAS